MSHEIPIKVQEWWLCLSVTGCAGSPFVTGRNEVVAKVMFLQVSVCSQGGRVSASVHAGMPYPPGTWQTPPGTWQTPPPDQADPPGSGRPPQEADSSIRSTSGRYASYLNAFLFSYEKTTIIYKNASNCREKSSCHHRSTEFCVKNIFLNPQYTP